MVDEKKCGFDVKTSSFNNLTLSFSGINFVGVVYQPPPAGERVKKNTDSAKLKKSEKKKTNKPSVVRQYIQSTIGSLLFPSLVELKKPRRFRWGFLLGVRHS